MQVFDDPKEVPPPEGTNITHEQLPRKLVRGKLPGSGLLTGQLTIFQGKTMEEGPQEHKSCQIIDLQGERDVFRDPGRDNPSGSYRH